MRIFEQHRHYAEQTKALKWRIPKKRDAILSIMGLEILYFVAKQIHTDMYVMDIVCIFV